MTIEEVIERVEKIKEVQDDPEQAHALEETLWHDVLKHIASGQCVHPAAFAIAALETENIDFPC